MSDFQESYSLCVRTFFCARAGEIASVAKMARARIFDPNVRMVINFVLKMSFSFTLPTGGS